MIAIPPILIPRYAHGQCLIIVDTILFPSSNNRQYLINKEIAILDGMYKSSYFSAYSSIIKLTLCQ